MAQALDIARCWPVFGAIGAMLLLLTAAASANLFGPIVVARSGPPADSELVLLSVAHALLGCMTAIGIWAAGAGIYRLHRREPAARLADVLIPAFPISLIVTAILCACALTLPWGRVVAATIWLACLVPLAGWRPPGGSLRRAGHVMIGVVPFALLFGVWLALLWHGPTDTLSGEPSGDLSFYASSIWSLAESPYPFVDFGYADGHHVSYFNQLYTSLGASLLPLPGFDPFLFLLGGAGASYVLLTALMLHLYLQDRIGEPMTAAAGAGLILSLVTAARYPYWVAESVPIVVVPALTISVWWMARRGRRSAQWALAAMLFGFAGSVLSKVVSGIVLVPLAASSLLAQRNGLPRWTRIAAAIIGVAFVVYCGAMLTAFLPVFVADAFYGPEGYRIPAWYFICRDVGAVVMIAAAWRAADRPVALTLTIGLASFLLFSWLFQINFVCVWIVAGLIVFADGGASRRVMIATCAATALSLPALFSDPAGLSSGAIWTVCTGSAFAAAIGFADPPAVPRSGPALRRSAIVAVTVLTIGAAALAGVARGVIIVDSGQHILARERLQPEVKAIWSAVRQTPKDAMIFTDQVGEGLNLLGGWNTYAFAGQRQIFLSSFYTARELRSHPQDLQRLLAINRAILDGRASPRDLATPRRYGHFFAVVSVDRLMGDRWQEVSRNRLYALYAYKGE